MRNVHCRNNDNDDRGVCKLFFFFDSYYLCYGTDLMFFTNSPDVLVTCTKDLDRIIRGVHIAASKIG